MKNKDPKGRELDMAKAPQSTSETDLRAQGIFVENVLNQAAEDVKSEITVAEKPVPAHAKRETDAPGAMQESYMTMKGEIMQISSKAEKIKARLLEFCTLMSFEYRGLYCDIDPFDPHLFHIMCGDEEQDVHSIEEVMGSPLFAGACLQDIADEVEILDW